MHVRLDRIDKYCFGTPGNVYITEGPGCRPTSTHANRYYCHDKRILVTSKDEECAISAVSNAIFAYGDEELARGVASVTERPSIRGLLDLSKWVEMQVRMYHLVGYRIEESIVSVSWVVNHCRDIILLHMTGSNDVNHIVCIDGRSGVIYDSLECRPMRLSEEALRCCVGDGSEIRTLKSRKFVKLSSAQHIGEPLSKRQKKRRTECERKSVQGSNTA